MKKVLLAATLLLSACVLSKLSALEYNNKVVEQVNQSSTAIETSASLYNQLIPDVVSEQDKIESQSMDAALNQASQATRQTETLSKLESRNEIQNQEVLAALTVYLSAAQLYLDAYEEMLNYYSTQAYKEDLTQVQILDETLHLHYTTFIEANNDLVEVLEKHVDK